MKEQIKTPEKELSDEEIDNLSDAEVKTLVISMLTEMIELSHKMKEKMKTIQREIKENIQETRTHINNLEQKEEINIQLEQNKETGIHKNEKGLGTYGTILNAITSKS